ncbi:hypothetical protein ACJMK2_010738, partial [Sinanodonta woodiana]
MTQNALGYLILLVRVIFIACQTLYNCPLGWESFKSHCYRFEFGTAQSYQNANSACWVKGSALVSVNTRLEFEFIANWLLRHDIYNKFSWYTSGEYYNGLIKWNGDGSYTNDTTTYFPGILPDETRKQKYIIYAFADATQLYEWRIVEGYSRMQYICEIPLKEVSRIVQINRGFDYGLPPTPYDKLEMGPKIAVQSQNMIVLSDSTLVGLDCIAKGNPQPQYTWFQQSSISWLEVNVASDTRYTFSNGRFSIENPVENKDSGTYQCKMENRFGSLISIPISLSFGRLDQFSPNTPGPVEAALYQGTFLQCNPPSAKPALTYQWYKDDIFNFIRPELQPYQFISSNGNLYFSEVQDYDSGFYHCVVTLTGQHGDQISVVQPPSRTSKGIQLKIRGAPSSEYGPIIHNDFIDVFPKPALAGQDIRLECFAYGRMPLLYRWTRSDATLPQGYRLSDSNRILTIPNAKMEDEGNYTCHVHRVVGSVTAAKSIYLVIEAKPTFIIPLHDMHADEGSELIWRCEVQAKPWATYTWYKNSFPLTSVPGEIEIRENVLWIRILDNIRDSGMYQCFATNAIGTATSGAQLRVLSFKPNFAKNPLSPEILAGQGGNITIECAPEAAPVPDIKWYHDGKYLTLIPGGDARVRMTTEGSLVITKVSLEDQGLYKCTATNINGEGEMASRLTVVSGLAITRTPVDAVVDVNQTHFFYCEASYNYEVFELVYVWKFNGRIINTHQDSFYRTSINIPGSRGLYIVNAQFKHSGTYECVAQSQLSEISVSAQLTVRGPPGEPVGVYADNIRRNSTSIRLYWIWNSVSDHGFPITYYVLEAKTNYVPEWRVTETDIPSEMTLLPGADHPDRRSYLVRNLSPHTAYSFRLRAGNSLFGAADPSLPTSFYLMLPDKPKISPENVGGGGGTEGTLTITWNSLSQADEAGSGFGYEVFWRLLNTTKWSNQRVGNVTKHTVTVGTEMYFLLYEVKVRAYNDHGDGPESTVSEIYSAEG